MRKCFLLTLVGSLILSAAHSAHAGTYNLKTSKHPLPSSITLGIYAGDPNAGGEILASIGPIGITGTMTADINTPGGNGSINVTSAALTLANFTQLAVPIGAIGEVDITTTGITFNFSGGPYPVAGNVVTLPANTDISVGIASGMLDLANPTGLLALLIPDGLAVDFLSAPISEIGNFANDINLGTTDEGPGLDSPKAEFNLTGQLAVPAFDLTDDLGFIIYAAISGDVHLAVPEPSTYALASMGLVGLAFAARRRLRGNR